MEKPPITGKEIAPLSTSALVGFKLAPGPVPDNYRFFDTVPGDAAILNGGGASTNKEPAGSAKDADDKSKHRKRPKRSLDDYEGALQLCRMLFFRTTREKVQKAPQRRGEREEAEEEEKGEEAQGEFPTLGFQLDLQKNDEEGRRVKETKEQQPFY